MGFFGLVLCVVILSASHLGHTQWYTIGNFASNQLPPATEANYDFIIVGAGSAGTVIANRLSEIASWRILLLEAGLPEDTLAEFPTLAALLQFTDYNWGYTTEPESHACLAMEEQRCAWPRGKALGGSSVINYMVYTRGNSEDYNRWAALGNPGWSYADVLPYFLKSEDAHLNASNQLYHNTGGYQSIENPFISELGNAFIDGGLELGYQNIDYNAPNQIGFSRLQVTLKNGRRHSTASAFLKPVLHRHNLDILIGVHVTKVLINPLTNQAYGVEYDWNGKRFEVKAAREVILSAGVFGSAQLLMLSGIGPRNHLTEHGIATLSDLPVGQTLCDHAAFLGLVIDTNITMGDASALDPLQVLEWYTTGTGPLSSILGNEAIAFIKTHLAEENYPDIELLLRVGSIRSDNGTIERSILRVSEEYYNAMYAPMERTFSFTIVPVLLHPKSRGSMKLRSSNPFDPPLLYGNYFTDSENHDIQTFIAAIRVIMKLCETNAFQRYNSRVNRKHFVRCEHLLFNSDEYWQCALRLMAISTYHQTSTCKMGPVDDPTAVVNHQLKVYGIAKLRVADTSIIPVTISGHTNGPAIMIGEVASDLIKKEWSSV